MWGSHNMQVPLLLIISLSALALAAAEEDIYYNNDVGVIEGKKLWFPEWRMQELLQLQQKEVSGSQEQRILDAKINTAPAQEFYLTDAEIQEVLQPQSFTSLEMRIDQVLQRRNDAVYDYDEYEKDFDEEDELDLKDKHVGQVRKGQQSSSLRGLRAAQKRGKRGRGKRDNGRGKRENGKRKKKGNKHKKEKKGKRGKRGKNKHQIYKYQNRQYSNICLDPPDRYRTCLSREEDPTNDVIGCDVIQRNSYNLGALMIKRGKWPPPSANSDIIDPLVPYQPPFILSDEVMTVGDMHLTLLQDTAKLTCNERIRVEETVLWYLQENVGEDDSFRPACVFLEEEAISEETVRDADDRIASTTALKFHVVYRTKKRFYNKQERRRLEQDSNTRSRNLLETCNTSNHHLCCSQDSINGDPGAFCQSIGCNYSGCGKRNLGVSMPQPGASGSRPGSGVGRPGSESRPQRPNANGGNRPNRPNTKRNVFDGDEVGEHEDWEESHEAEDVELGHENSHERRMRRKKPRRCGVVGFQDKSFEQVMKQNTVYKQFEVALSLLNDTDTSAVASCSVNWYIVENGGIPSETCDQYDERDCINSEDLVYQDDAERCLQPSAAPSASPTFPTVSPTETPTYIAIETEIPTVSPTLGEAFATETEHPTLSPSMVDTEESHHHHPTPNPSMVDTQELETVYSTPSPSLADTEEFVVTWETEYPTPSMVDYDSEEEEYPTFSPTLSPTFID